MFGPGTYRPDPTEGMTAIADLPPPMSRITRFGFDHGVGHPLLFLCDAKVPNCRKNKAFKDLGHYSEWPKVADAVIKAHVSVADSTV